MCEDVDCSCVLLSSGVVLLLFGSIFVD